MLRELSVQNLALIEDVRVELRPGFCAWTGETGAGKSLLLGALGLLLGERASTDLLRSGADELRVTGVFELSHPDLKRRIAALLNTDPDTLDNQLLLARRVHRSGRSGAYINDQPVALATLRAVGSLLVDIHGQRESAALLDPSYQLDLLDAFGNLHDYKACYIEKAERLRLARKRWAELAAAREQRQRELSLVRFEREELDQARLEPGEREELTRERDRLANAQQLQAFAHTAYALLYEDEGSVHERIGRVQRDAESWADLDPELTETVTHLDGLLTQVKDVAQTLRRLGERWEADPERLAEVETRLHLLRKLESKYRKSIDELILYRLSLDDQESRLQAAEDDLSALEGEIQSLLQQTRDAALDLSRQRHKVAKKLAAEVEKQLADLGMPEAKLGTELTTKQLTLDDIPATGIDHLELTLAANPGEPARPLRKVASGGEMSRTMLALKTVLAQHDHTATLVFDEIDANVGGRLGDVLGSKLAALGRSHQVICVTHLAPVASYAKHHWTIRKTKIKNRTVTQITPLQDEEQRLEELASMLRGESRTDSTRHEVQQMLQSARAAW